MGIPMKLRPSMALGSFLSDNNFHTNCARIDLMLQKAKAMAVQLCPKNPVIVIPSAGIGTGMAQLAERAPETWKYLLDAMDALEAV